MGTQLLMAENLPEIPSEYIEPYFQRFMSMEMESIALGYITPAKAKERLKAVESFANYFTGLHCRIAVDNEYKRFCSVPDQELFEICQKIYKNL